jgi:hypothetical protein
MAENGVATMTPIAISYITILTLKVSEIYVCNVLTKLSPHPRYICTYF